MTDKERKAYYEEKGRLDGVGRRGYNEPGSGPPVLQELVEFVIPPSKSEIENRQAYREGYGVGQAQRKARDE